MRLFHRQAALTLTSLASLVLCAGASPASAAIVTAFSGDLAGWTAAASSPVVVDNFSDPGLRPAGFSITTGPFSVIENGRYLDLAQSQGQAQNPTLNFAPGATAFGANWDLEGPGGAGAGLQFFITFVDGTTLALTDQIPNIFDGDDFFGIVSDTAIASIRLDQGTQGGNIESFTVDNARIVFTTDAVAVAEPATLVVFGLGLTGLGIAGRRRRAA